MMLQVPSGSQLMKEMLESLPLYCHSTKSNTKALMAQGLRLSDKTRLEVVGVYDFGDAGGVMCEVKLNGKVLIMSLTGLDFIGNGSIYEKIAKYKTARIGWLKQEELRDREKGIAERIKIIGGSSSLPPRNGLCPCGSGKKV